LTASRMISAKLPDIGYRETCAPENTFLTSLRWHYPDQL
jgi:hypothetical protein